MKPNLKVLPGLLIALATSVIPVASFAANWPERPISLVVPYAPGGTADALSRMIAQHLGPRLNTQVVIVNKPGASGIIGSGFVAQAQPDGYTALYDATPLSINPNIQKLPFDPLRDLVPVTQVAVTPMLLAVPSNSPFKTLADLLAAAKAEPGKLTFSSGGQGTVQFMGAALFAQGAGIQTLHVPYKSGGPAIVGVIGGEVDYGFSNLPSLTPHIKAGKLRALAITSARRDPQFADVPTIAEAAVKGYEAYEWNGVFMPKGTSPEIVKTFQQAIKDVLAMPEVKARFDALGSQIIASTPEQFAAHFQSEVTRWAATVKAAGIAK
jgi:tripartite-type tricarboxylate transporter receptor subunit TctC